MEKHISIIGVLWIVLGSLGFVGGFILWGLLFGISFIPDMGYEAPFILRTAAVGAGLLLWILSIPKIIAGIGLLKHKEWARILALILSFLSLLNFPLGTALAVYSFVILIKEETIRVFKT